MAAWIAKALVMLFLVLFLVSISTGRRTPVASDCIGPRVLRLKHGSAFERGGSSRWFRMWSAGGADAAVHELRTAT
jgi:hypothetical protein